MSKRNKKSHLWFFVPVLLTALMFAQSTTALAERKSQTSKTISTHTVIEYTNKQRLEHKLPVLVANERLTASAQRKANEMAALGLFAHTMSDGRQSWDYILDSGYIYRNAGENLAVHYVNEKVLVAAWMNSPTHRANILNKTYKDVGVGIAFGTFNGYPGYLVVQHLGEEQ
jgi:uncharacterized protein YkwD